MIKTRFESIGLFLPEQILSTKELIEKMTHKPSFDFEELTGIKNRRTTSEDEDSYKLALNAARDCLKNSRYNANELDIIIYCSITKFKDKNVWYYEPSMSHFLKNEIGAVNAMNFDISNACAGMISGAYILDNMIKSGVVKNGLVISGERITPIAETAAREIDGPFDDQFASLTVGDSSAAFIMDTTESEDEKIDLIDIITAADFAHMCLGMPSDKTPGVAMYAKSSEMHRNSTVRWPVFLEYCMQKNNKIFNPDDYNYIIFHQTAERAIKKFVKAGEKYFNTKMPEAICNVREYGNTSTTTHFLALYQNIKNKKIKKGSKVLLIGLASGMIFATLSTTLGHLEI